jgi:type IV pilus assembly protein PilC
MLRIVRVLLELAFWTVAAGVAMFALGLVLALGLGVPFGFLSPAVVLLMLPLIAKLMRTIRRRRGLMALSYLDQAVRLNLPLPRMLWAAQRSEGGRLGRRLHRLRLFVEQGYPIATALDEAVPEVTRRAVAIAGAAERVGRLPQALARLVDEERRRTAGDAATSTFYHAYPIVMLLFVNAILGMIMIFVIPKFEQIFKDFGCALPPLTQFVMTVSWSIGPLLIVISGALAMWYLGRSMWETLHPSAFRGTGPMLGALDRALWYLPVSHGVQRDRGLADVCAALADAFAAGAPADTAVSHSAGLRVNRVLRDRVAVWGQLIAAGGSLADAARRAGLPELLAGMLATARGPGDAADVFAFLARYYRARFSRTAALLEGALIPFVVLVFGAIVCCVALAMFLPMIRLMDQVTLYTGLM